MIWRVLFPIVIIFTLFDGFISNIYFTDIMPLLYKDILIIIIFAIFLMTEHWRDVGEAIDCLGRPVILPAGIFVLWSVLQMFNPHSPSAILGLLGLKVYFLYWLLIPMSYLYVVTKKHAYSLLKWISLAAIPINLFGLYQFFYGPFFLIAKFGYGFERSFFEAALEGQASKVKSFYRVIGTFASTGQYSSFLMFGIMFCIALIYATPDRRAKLFWIASAFLNFILLLATGSRGYLLTQIMALAFFVYLSRKAGLAIMMALFVALSLGVGLNFLGSGVAARIGTIGEVKTFRHRTVDTTGQMFIQSMDRYPMGQGIGSVSVAARHLKIPGAKNLGQFVENYVAKLQIETGLPGLFLFSLMLFFLIKVWVWEWIPRSNHSPPVMALSACGFSYIFLNYLFGIFDSPPGYIYFCVVIGIVAKLSLLEARENPYESYQD